MYHILPYVNGKVSQNTKHEKQAC